MTDLAIFLATSGHSGVDRVACNLLSGLVGLGVDCDLITINGHGPYLPEGGDYERVRRIGLPARHVDTALPGLVRYLRRERPTVLMTDKYRVNRMALLARAIARVPTRLALRIGTTVSVDLANRDPWTRHVERWGFRHLYPRADYVLMPSRQAAADLEVLAGWPEGRVRVVPSPVVDPARFDDPAPPDHPWFAPGGPPVILGAGELSGRKDHATLLRAFARLRRRRDARLVILGRGSQHDRLLELARELGVEADVDLPGFVAEPVCYMAHSAAFALTSRWEGAPVVLIEALACGTPVVSTDCPSGPREVLDEGRVAPLVPMGDDAALADALAGVLDTPPEPAVLREAVAAYGIRRSARGYLAAVGLTPREED
ncbi:glycosyltransferase [Arhodomonas sp. SL1]|uniref:glycosyltransferase n=1 Tax=Arhodomonas sp. SL1 TaxID=3425691 RepID=UPI003F885415